MNDLRHGQLTLRRIADLVAVALFCASVGHGQTHTLVWGKDGDRWKPDDNTLLDFSEAGYQRGANDFPDWPIGTNVRDFGAKGDGETDDTPAIWKAIQACPRDKVVYFPNGTYRINDWLGVREMVGKWVKPAPKSRFALRGESRDGTTLLLGVGLQDIHPWERTTGHGRPATQWSWWGGFLWFQNAKQVGVENLTIRGNGGAYDIHWQERGFNGVAFRNVEDGWIRNLRFVDVDNGIFVKDSKHVTIESVWFESSAGRPSVSSFENNRGMSGHHGISFIASTHCLADDITFKNEFHHELTLSTGSSLCVFSNCRGSNLHFDFHTAEDNLPNNLFTQIDAGRGDLIWRNNFHGACTGSVFWNIRGQNLSLPFKRAWTRHPVKVEEMKTLLAGWPIDLPDQKVVGRPWFEDIPPDRIQPPNIYHAQRARRLRTQTLNQRSSQDE